MGGVILGDWTHRRGDVGGGRAVAAELVRPRPKVAWTFRPRDGASVDQVRIAGERVYVATMPPGDPAALGWEHATIFALEVSALVLSITICVQPPGAAPRSTTRIPGFSRRSLSSS